MPGFAPDDKDTASILAEPARQVIEDPELALTPIQAAFRGVTGRRTRPCRCIDACQRALHRPAAGLRHAPSVDPTRTGLVNRLVICQIRHRTASA